MPTYTYSCPHCGRFEFRQSINDAALEQCPSCGVAVERIVTSTGGFIVKGGNSTARDCGRETPCCGRKTRCERPACDN